MAKSRCLKTGMVVKYLMVIGCLFHIFPTISYAEAEAARFAYIGSKK